MKKKIPKRRGRPATGKDPSRTFRLSDEFMAQLDDWAARQDDKPTRSEAIRRLVEIGLSAKNESPRKSEDTQQRKDTKQRARELAGDAIDGIAEAAASPEDQASRKRRLIKGPEEFQKVRRDRNST
ncbi:hypothetical protein [Bradyrhizobium pachyrhizi]|uniref:hypothetical protein n=1 Tax=Bradyrhizobium pachyrhizi TaxID=280333 RepID=UPI003D369BF8